MPDFELEFLSYQETKYDRTVFGTSHNESGLQCFRN
jgi:hypothetical protein